MKTYTIKITGSGTAEQITDALTQIIWDVKDVERRGEGSREIEDAVLFTEITEEDKP